MTKTQLWKLRNEIVLDSMYINDYANTFNIDINLAFDFFDAYTDFLYDTILSDGYTDDEYYEQRAVYDTVENLYYFYEYELSEYIRDCVDNATN